MSSRPICPLCNTDLEYRDLEDREYVYCSKCGYIYYGITTILTPPPYYPDDVGDEEDEYEGDVGDEEDEHEDDVGDEEDEYEDDVGDEEDEHKDKVLDQDINEGVPESGCCCCSL